MRTFLTCCLLSFCCLLSAEIKRVTVGFTKELCDQKCLRLVKDRFEGLEQANSISVSPGQIVLGWKPNEKFHFRAVDARMRLIGLGMDNISVTVRGTVSKQGNRWYVNSLGDKTRFQLLNPPKPSSNSYVEYNNISNYALYPSSIDQLEEAKKGDRVVTASGFLLAPWRYPLTIVLGSLQAEDPPEQ